MSGAVAEFGLGLPQGWHVLPGGGGDPSWARQMAESVAGDHEEYARATSLLTQQLLDVRASVDETGAPSVVQVAVLVDDATSPLVSAMMTAVLTTDADEETYQAQLAEVARDVEGAQVMGNQLFDAQVPAGRVVGTHLLIGHMQDGAGDESVHLEERVHAAVFLAGTSDALDLMVVAANVGLFDDLSRTVVDLLENVTFRTGDAA